VSRPRKSKRKAQERASDSLSIGASLVPGSKLSPTFPPDLVPEDNSLTHVAGSRASDSLPLLQLQTQQERDSLRSLKLRWGDEHTQQEFDVLVLARLKMIDETRTVKGKRDPATPAKSETAKNLKRRAERVRRFIGYLERPSGRAVHFLPPAPVRELLLYADGLDHSADHLATFGDSLVVASISNASGSSKHPPRRKTAPETEHIFKLAEFIRRHTGQEHHDELVTLLKQATGDKEYNKHRLQSLLSLHRRKKTATHRHFLEFCRSLRSRPK
jgi:hypothetical protein